MRTVYVNGRFVSEDEAAISPFDRGFLFGDAVYEVTAVIDRRILEFDSHMKRLERSLAELDMTPPLSTSELLSIHRELIERNALDEGIIYLQISRGVGERDFTISPDLGPATVVLFTQKKALRHNPVAQRGIRVVTAPDLRWARRDIKTTQLLYPSLVKSRGVSQGADDVWMVENGHVTEGTSNNAFIINAAGEVVTRPTSTEILHGITRACVMECAREGGFALVERPFTVAEAETASEAFVTSASGFVVPVISVNGHALGEGRPGPFARRLRELYLDQAMKTAI